MANTLELRRRIKTAQNVSKTTRAMQMIAASKLKRAQAAVVASRPYVTSLIELTRKLAPKDEEKRQITGKTLYILISPDKGLSGALNSNVIKEYAKLRSDDKNIFITIGKKITNAVASSNKNLLASFSFGNTLPLFEQILPIKELIEQQYAEEKIDSVKIICSQFQSVFLQVPKTIDLLPLQLTKAEEIKGIKETGIIEQAEFIFEPSKEDLFPELVKRYVEMVLYQQFLENYASFNAAQMIAMQNATDNAKDIVSELQLLYNKARQEKITKEILDISSAALALGTL